MLWFSISLTCKSPLENGVSLSSLKANNVEVWKRQKTVYPGAPVAKTQNLGSVSYTHLDVYKRQRSRCCSCCWSSQSRNASTCGIRAVSYTHLLIRYPLLLTARFARRLKLGQRRTIHGWSPVSYTHLQAIEKLWKKTTRWLLALWLNFKKNRL